jgi:hypothetical protein
VDDVGAGGKFDALRCHFEGLKEIGPNFGYYPESSKIIIIVRQHNYASAQEAFQDLKFTITTSSHYFWWLHWRQRILKRMDQG